MLTKIREKTQGTFAWAILVLICVPFALMGLNNYTDNMQEDSLVSVGEKEFSQNDVNQAYDQFKQQYANMQVPEALLKRQAIEKLVSDELLLQHVTAEKLTIPDETARKFVASLQYFQKEGQFNKKQYESLLTAQGMSSAQFVNRVRKALLMEQFQKAITESSFISEKEIQQFFKIQNQTRSLAYTTVKVKAVKQQPTAEKIDAYYLAHTNDYQTQEQASIEYLELSLTDLMKDIQPSDEKVKTYYEDNKSVYSKKERRKISHILFAQTKEVNLEQALEKAQAAKLRLEAEAFASVAKELSDDSLTAKTGGDLGLFEVGVMEADFEKAASSLKLGEISQPVKSAFGYHLITVTELVPGVTKAFSSVKEQVKTAVQRVEAETVFYELSESLAELSFENSDTLQVVAETLDMTIHKTALFERNTGKGIAAEEKIRNLAFSESVLKGNNSEPVELGDDKLVVLRILEHQPTEAKPVEQVRKIIVAAIQAQQAKENTRLVAEEIKAGLLAGKTLTELAQAQDLTVNKLENIKRDSSELAWELNQAVFKAAKPTPSTPSLFIHASANGEQTVIQLNAVQAGDTKGDSEKEQLAKMNITKALGKADYSAVIDGLRTQIPVLIKQ